jgi:hypothetical protein
MLAMTSPNYGDLYSVFLDTLRPDDHGVNLKVCTLDLSTFGEFGFRTDAWYHVLTEKVRNIIDELNNVVPEGEYLVVSDVDIQWFEPSGVRKFVEDARRNGFDWYGMREGGRNEYNGGFYVVRNVAPIRGLFADVLERLSQEPKPPHGDQTILNELIPKSGIRHAQIPQHSYVWGDSNPMRHAVFHHAVCAFNNDDKRVQMERVRRKMSKFQGGVAFS